MALGKATSTAIAAATGILKIDLWYQTAPAAYPGLESGKFLAKPGKQGSSRVVELASVKVRRPAEMMVSRPAVLVAVVVLRNPAALQEVVKTPLPEL